jgi:hypothetical protein
VLRRLFVFTGVILTALALAGAAVAVTVTVRVEGVTKTLFGADESIALEPAAGTIVAADGSSHPLAPSTALGALEAASLEGEFYYKLDSLSFGLFVSQIGRHAGVGASGWVYKVNGVSPPVGAADYIVKEGDDVLWYYARFGDTGGPATLDLETSAGDGTRCYQAVARDDAGKASNAADVVYLVDGKRIRSESGRLCPDRPWHRLRATTAGAVRSKVVHPG